MLPDLPTKQHKSHHHHAHPVIIQAEVVFDYKGDQKNSMPLRKGEIIEVTQRGKPGGWSKGKNGAFPTDYVKFIEKAPQSNADPFAMLSNPGTSQSAPAPAPQMQERTSMTGGGFAGKDLSIFDSLGDSSTTDVEGKDRASTRGSIGDSFASSKPRPQTAQFDFSDVYRQSESPKEPHANPMLNMGGDMATAPASRPSIGAVTSIDPFAALQQPATSSSSMMQQSSTVTATGTGTNLISQTTSVDIFGAGAGGTTATEAVPPAPASGPKGTYARVKFNKPATSGTELSMTAGDTLAVLGQDGEWWYGTNIATGKSGYFPWNYVEVRDDLDPNAKVKAPEIKSRPPPAAPLGAKLQAAQIIDAVMPTQTASASELTKQSRNNAPVLRRQIQKTVPRVAQLSGENFAKRRLDPGRL